MIKWLDIDDTRYSRTITEARPGMPPVERGVSVYEIPSRVGIESDPQHPTCLSVIFEYLSDEPASEFVANENLRIWRGAHSGRLRKATVDLMPLLQNRATLPHPDEVADYLAKTVASYIINSAGNTSLGHRRSFITGRVIKDHSGDFVVDHFRPRTVAP